MDDWERLYRADPLATPYSSPGWARAWLDAWAEDEAPYVLRVHDGAGTVAIAPFSISRRAGLRVLGMLGKEPADYWDLISEPGLRVDASLAVGAALAARRRAWDLAVLSCMPPGSATAASLERAGLRVHRRAPVPCPAIDLPATFEDYLAGLDSRVRRNIRRSLRSLDNGVVQLRAVTDPARLPAAIEAWQDLRERQWRGMGKSITPSHTSERFRRFMLAATRNLVADGTALVWEFLHEERIAGSYLSFADARAQYWFLGGFDPERRSLGLGKLAASHAIRTSIEAGRERFDFTRGGEDYKYEYLPQDRRVESLLVGHDGVRSRLVLPPATLDAARRDRAS